MPSMLTSVAFVVCQLSVVDWPFSTVLGLAVSEAVGAAGGGGGGGGGGGVFLWHPPSNRMAARVIMSEIHFDRCCFTFPPCKMRASQTCALGFEPGETAGSPGPKFAHT